MDIEIRKFIDSFGYMRNIEQVSEMQYKLDIRDDQTKLLMLYKFNSSKYLNKVFLKTEIESLFLT